MRTASTRAIRNSTVASALLPAGDEGAALDPARASVDGRLLDRLGCRSAARNDEDAVCGGDTHAHHGAHESGHAVGSAVRMKNESSAGLEADDQEEGDEPSTRRASCEGPYENTP
jgi:hypothetical protein